MAGRPMTHSLSFINFLPGCPGISDLQDLADQEEALVAELVKVQEKIKAVRELSLIHI